MKKLYVILIVIALMLSLCACGQIDTEAIEKELFGIWSYYNVMPEGTFESAYIFAKGEVACMTKIGGFENTSEGVYTIEKDEIKIEYENGIVTGLSYTFQDDELRLFSDDVELEKING